MFKKTGTAATVTLDSFAGIDLRRPVGADTAVQSVNFRIMPDGSLKKRAGYRKVISLSGIPSGVSMTFRNSSEICYAVVGNRIYELELDGGTVYTIPGTLPFSPTHSSVVVYKNLPLLFTGSVIRSLDNGISTLEGYVPLYGKNWHPTLGGEISEPQNLLSMRLRVNYRMPVGVTSVVLPKAASSVARVEVNGTALAATQFTFDSAARTVSSDSFTADSSVTVWFAMSDSVQQNTSLGSCRYAAVTGSGDRTVMFCWYSESGGGKYVFRSVPVSSASALESRRGYALSQDLYFPSDNAFTVGSGGNCVNAVLPIGERAVVYSDNEAWLVSCFGEKPEPALLNSGIGCSSPGAAVICGELPVTVCGRGIYIWEPDADSYNELSAVCISDAVASELDENFAVRAKILSDRENGELWFYDPAAEAKPVIVYNRESRQWYTYSGFLPKTAFVSENHAAFSEGADICVFDPDAANDYPDGTEPVPVCASYTGGWLDFGTGDVKHAGKLSLKAETNGCPVGVTVEFDRGDSAVCGFSGNGVSVSPELFTKRLPKRRFGQLRVCFSANGAVSQRIYGVTVGAVLTEK